VVCWNAADVLGRCLDQLLLQDYTNYEIVVVDDGSEDNTIEIAESAAKRGEVKIVRSPANRGCPHARNIGLSQAAGEILAFIDADGFAASDWLREVVQAFDGDPTIGAIASTVFFEGNPLVINGAGGTVNRQGWAADLSMNESYEQAQIVSEALYPMGCGMAIRRVAVEQVGPFDDRMLNYYDDVDYGTRIWRARYRIVVAPDAWVDHRAAGCDSAAKRLLCERHRMRVVLKHAPLESLGRWAAHEARELLAASAPVRLQKLRAITWNMRHLPSVLAARRRMWHAGRVPERLLDESWGDGFPAGVPQRSMPSPQRASARVAMGDDHAASQLVHGWFPTERAGDRRYRWAGTHAALLVSLHRPAACVRIDYAHAPEDVGDVEIAVRRIDSGERLDVVWRTRLRWQYIARALENHPVELPQGDYEVLFRTAKGWLEPPLKARVLGFALAEIDFEDRFEIESGGLDMASPSAEHQLAGGWFELEQAPEHAYRWSSARAAAIVRLTEDASAMRLRYRMAPGYGADLDVSVAPVGSASAEPTWQIAWRQDGWHEETIAATLGPGDYVVTFELAKTWSNPRQEDPDLPPENRALGFALASISFD
jgi:GT2 family glycosyltransferase